MGKIYFWTRTYNHAKELPRCIDSVLNQTKYADQIEYWFCDNGSTDNTREILEEYARKDPRMKLLYNEKNNEWNEESDVFWDLPRLINEDDYFCTIDSDDEYKPDFLEKMIPFILENDLDIGIAGNDFVDAETGQIAGQRVLNEPLILDTPEKFRELFPSYHAFTRTHWSKVFSGRITKYMCLKHQCSEELWANIVGYAFDTYMVYSVLKHSKRVGIFPETFYRWSMYNTSTSYVWYYGRFNCDQIINETTEEFLEMLGPISEQNRFFLDIIFANSLSDSIKVLLSVQGMTGEEKLKELRKAVDYRVTSDMMVHNTPDILNSRALIFGAAMMFGKTLDRENEDFTAALKLICPNCAPYISVEDIGLYENDDELKSALFCDNMTGLVERLLHLISGNMYSEQFDLFKILKRFSEYKGLAPEFTDPEFIKEHGDIFLLIWKFGYSSVMGIMTKTLHGKVPLDEVFYHKYITLASALERNDEVLLGKTKLAEYYKRNNRSEEYRTLLDELEKMGVKIDDTLI